MTRHEPATDVPRPGLPNGGDGRPEQGKRPVAPTMSELLASCAAASAVSTPPGDVRADLPAPDAAPEDTARRDAA